MFSNDCHPYILSIYSQFYHVISEAVSRFAYRLHHMQELDEWNDSNCTLESEIDYVQAPLSPSTLTIAMELKGSLRETRYRRWNSEVTITINLWNSWEPKGFYYV